jgi:Phosphatidylserine/phosphatidylglycerophosphate/cardiolipin synthases and related enzymes
MPSLTFFTVFGYLLALVAAVHLLSLRKNPASTLAWLWGILLFPYLGALLYWAIGADRLRRKRLRRRAGFAAFRRDRLRGRNQKALESVPPEDAGLARVLARLTGIPPTGVDSLRLLHTADAFYDALLARVEAARHHVHIQFFIWREDEAGRRLRDALVAAARRGVVVRVLLDEIGSVLLAASHFRELVEAGGEFSWFQTISPLRRRFLFNLRNHRKVQIVDGAVAFVGGMNVGREYQGLDPKVGPWRDLQAELTGPVACALQESFADDWFYATGRKVVEACYYPESAAPGKFPCLVVAGGPDDPSAPMQTSIVAILAHATRRAWFTTGYFVPNGVTLIALQLCAARGVDVRLLITEKTDHPGLLRIGRSFYDELMAAGVRIFEYSLALNHTKAAVIDEDWLLVGSANLDNRSLRVNFELSTFTRYPAAAAELAARLEEDFSASTEIIPENFARRPRFERAVEATLRPFAPLL